MSVRILVGDCRDRMRELDADSVDACVTDPPYGLSFMGKGWDHGVPGVEFWTEALRVLKPGAHLLAFGGTRTFHRLACAIEDAGFEVRDCVMWVYGSGFPKSLDVSKAIDKRGGVPVAWFGPWLRKWREEKGVTQKEIAALFPSKTGGLTGCVANWELGFNLPTNDQFNLICSTFGFPFASMVEAERETLSQIEQSKLAVAPGQGADRSATVIDITAPATDAAREWTGWGTALKPAWEPIIVARKPLRGTVSANVQQFGTGALNIDGCRIEHANDADLATSRAKNPGRVGLVTSGVYGGDRPQQSVNDAGRWPANVVHDGSDEVVALFPESTSEAGDGYRHSIFCGGKPTGGHGLGDTGSAARFFYCAKADRADRDDGLHHREPVRRTDGRTTEHHVPNLRTTARSNHHPTVKPTDLMRWLVRLVTPRGGTVLDPFMGSGSTGRACEFEGMNFIGIELDAEYAEIARARIRNVAPLFAEMAAD